jgi:hypothetical protein
VLKLTDAANGQIERVPRSRKRRGKLYEAAIQQVRNPDVLNRFREFYQQTRKHVDILTRVITALGGDPMHMSHGATAAGEKAEGVCSKL